MGKKYYILGLIAEGSFGSIYYARNMSKSETDPEKNVAVKVEKCSDGEKKFLEMEMKCMTYLQGCQHIAKLYQYGQQDGYCFMMMELLGPSILELMLRYNKFSVSSAIQFGIQGLEALEMLHKEGFIHRDVKLSNFVIGRNLEKCGYIYLIDFGMVKRIYKVNGEIFPPRTNTGFRGTIRYSSLSAHKGNDQGRVDDLWSLLYCIVNLLMGALPWQGIKDSKDVCLMKEKYMNSKLFEGLPEPCVTHLTEFVQHLLPLGFYEIPDYSYLKHLLSRILSEMGYDENVPFEWELRHRRIRNKLESVSVVAEKKMKKELKQGPRYIHDIRQALSP